MRCSSSYIVSRRAWLLLVTLSLIFTATAPLLAQESSDLTALSLEELLNAKVYSASKYEQTAAEAPSSITVITAEEIRTYGYKTLQEALQGVTGFYVKNHGSYSTLGVRGFAPAGDSNGRILFLVNGHALNNNIDDSVPIADDFPIDMDLIDRVEIVRGPSSSLYGADAFFGVVNVITRTGSMKGTEISGEAGSLGTYKETATYGLDRNGTQALFSASYWDTAAPGKLSGVEDPLGSPSDHDQTRRAFALVASHGFTLQASASSVEQKAPPSAQWCGTCHQTDTHTTNFRGFVDMQYDHPVWKGVQFTARTYYDTYAYHGTYNDPRTSCSSSMYCHGNKLIDYDTAHGDKAGAEVKLTKRFLDKHTITIGTEYRDNFRQAQDNYYVEGNSIPPSVNMNYNHTSAIWGIYGEGEFHLHPKLILDAGVRNDRYNYFFGSTTNPRGALIYTPQKSTTLKFIYGTAFRAPSFSELYYGGMAVQSAPNLKAESIRTFEGDIEQRLGHRLTLAASGFYNHIGSYIEQQTVVVGGIDQTTFSNSKATAKGAEFELVGKLPSGVEGRLSYSYTDARNEITGAALPDSPKNLVKLNIASPLLHRTLTPSIEAQYMSRCSTVWPAVGYSAPPVLLNAAVSSRQLWRGFSIAGGVYNLVGRSMSEKTMGYTEPTPPENFYTLASPSLLPDDRRTYRLKITWNSGEHSAKDKPDTHTEATH